MPHLHMQVRQPGNKQKTCIKIFLYVQGHAIHESLLKIAGIKFEIGNLFSQTSGFVPGRQNP